MKYEAIMNDLKNKIYKPIYYLMGEESFYIDKITDFIADNVLTKEERAFNLTIFYGKDIDIATIITAARRYPMMANHQVIIVKEAQDLKKIDDLAYYLEKPTPSTLLVFNHKYGKLDARKKIAKLIAEKALLFESTRPYDDKIPDWIEEYLKQKKCTIVPAAAQTLVEFLGNDLSKIANELDKLVITLPAGTNKITGKHVEKNIGISKDFNSFELNKAICYKQILKANRIINYYAKNPRSTHITVTIGLLYALFSKLMIYHSMQGKPRNEIAASLGIKPFFLKEYDAGAKNYSPSKIISIISMLREYDMKSKGVGNTSVSYGDLLRELLFKILH